MFLKREVMSFCCQGEVSLQDDLKFVGNYCLNGELEKLFCQWKQCDLKSCKVFGLTTSVSSAFTKQADILRSLCIKKVSSLQDCIDFSRGSFSVAKVPGVKDLRKEVCTLLDFLKINTKCLVQGDDSSASVTEILQNYLSNIKKWALSFGRISDIPEHVLEAAVSSHNTSTAEHCLFHLNLDFWWFMVAVYQTLDSSRILSFVSNEHRLACNAPCQNQFIGGLIFLLLWDLVSVASQKFKKLHQSDYLKVLPFHCSCVKELWILLLHLTDHRHQTCKEESLWMYLHCIFEGITSDLTTNTEEPKNVSRDYCFKPDAFKCEKPVEFCLWIIWGVSSLHKYDLRGRISGKEVEQSNYFEVQKLVTSLLSTQNENKKFDEGKAQYCLRICLNLSQIWEPNVDLLVAVSDVFLKQLDNINLKITLGIQAHCLPKNSAHEWITEIKALVSRNCIWNYNDSSFQLFIMLISCQIHKVQQEKLVHSWRRVAGKMFLKLSRPTLKGLTEFGFHNLLTLLLALSCISCSREICNRVIAVTGMLTSDYTKQNLLWKALYALTHSYQQNKEDAAFLTKALVDQFTNAVQSFVKKGNDFNSRQQQQKLIVLYLNEMQNVFSCSPNLALSEHLLIGESFSLLLPHCSLSEFALALYTIEQAVVQLRCLREEMSKESDRFFEEADKNLNEKHQSLVDQLYQYVLPFVESHALTQTPPDAIANIAAGLALLSADGFTSAKMKDVSYFINKFGLDVDVNVRMSSIFLCHTIAENKIINKLSSTQQIQILGMWLRSTLTLDSKHDQTEQFGRLVACLPEVNKRFPDLHRATHQNVPNESIIIEFFQLLSERFKHTTSAQEKAAMKSYLQEAITVINTEVKNQMKDNRSQEVANHVLKITGHLVYFCSPMLYIMGAPRLPLPSILEATVLPVSLVKDKVLTQTMVNACRDHLHLFLMGLVQHNFKADPYIARKLRDLIVEYLPKYPVAPGKIHPLLNFQPCTQITKQRVDDLLLFIVETICDKFLSKKTTETQSQVSMAVFFISDVIRQATPENKLRIASAVFPSVFELLGLNIIPVYIQDLLNLLLSWTEKNEDFRKSLIKIIKGFVERDLPWQSKHVFTALQNLATLKKSLVAECFPCLSENVAIIENRRGVGLDKSLRDGMKLVTTALLNNPEK